MPSFSRRPSTMNSFSPAEAPQNSMADQQRLQISELHFDKISTPSTFSCWKIRFKTQASPCSDFPSEAMLWVKEVEMIDSVDDFKSTRSVQCKIQFPNFEMLNARIPSAPNMIIQNSYFKKKVSLEEPESSERRSVLSRKTDRLHDLPLLRLTGAHDTVLDYVELLSVARRNDEVQEFLIRDGLNFCYLLQRSHLTTSWKVCTNSEYGSLINSKPYWICMTWKFIRRYRGLIIRS